MDQVLSYVICYDVVFIIVVLVVVVLIVIFLVVNFLAVIIISSVRSSSVHHRLIEIQQRQPRVQIRQIWSNPAYIHS